MKKINISIIFNIVKQKDILIIVFILAKLV